MKTIALTRNILALVDDEDFEKLSKHKWFAYPHGKTFYAMRVINKNGKSHKIRMHREIMNVQKGFEIDHKDRNGWNNQKSNLRICTKEENNRNRGLQKNNKSGVPGVWWRKEMKKWRVFIRSHGKLIHLGHFDSKDEAIKVRLEATKKHHKEYAYNN